MVDPTAAMHDALLACGADYADVRIENVDSLRVSVTSGVVTVCRRARNLGGVVRALVHGAWGVAVFDGMDRLEVHVRRAVDAARAVALCLPAEDRASLAIVEPVVDSIQTALVEDFRNVPLDVKLDVLRQTDQGIRNADEGILRSTTSYAEEMRCVWLVTSEGTTIHETRPMLDMGLTGFVKSGELELRASEALSQPNGFEICRDRRDMIERLAARTRGLRDAIAPPSAKLPVVMDPVMTGLFAHEAFGHLCEADNVYRDPSLLSVMHMGRRFGAGLLTLGDDGSIPGLRATHRYDDEGVPTRRTVLLQDGVLVGRMHTRETAARLGESPTGNAWAVSASHTPIVRMSNTFIEPGPTPFEEMIADIDLGLYACGHFGGQTTKELFVFNGSHGYMIRKGRLAEMVRNVTLTGNVFDTLHDIDAVGNDQTWHQLGYCGKAGQSGHPTAKGAPHVRVRGLVVGGK